MTRKCETKRLVRAEDLGSLPTVICLMAIVALGLALRLYRLGAESVWWDEFTSLTHMDAPSLWAFLKLNRTLDPATLPLYYVLEYLWHHHVHASVYSLRLFSISLGMAGVLLLYAFGRDLFGRCAGLVAALCLALSPVHIHHSQGIRMYVLMTLLALLSAYTFMRLVKSWEPRWWAAHVLGNLLLLWTHPFALLLIGVEAAFLVLFRLRPVRRGAAWLGAHGLIMMPSVLYLSRVRFWPQESTSSWIQMPTFAEFLGDVFADDVAGFTYQLRLSGYWATAGLRHVADLALTLALLAAVLGLGWHMWRQRRENPARLHTFWFLLGWLVVPATVLYVVSVVWRPCIFPRYTLHSSLAMYLIVGGAAALVQNPWKRSGVVAAIACLLGFQWAMLQPGPQRTDWQSAATLIHAQAKTKDLVLVQVGIFRDVFEYNFGSSNLAVASAESVRTLASQAGLFLDLCRQSGPDKSRVVWAVILTPYFDSGPNQEFEDTLRTQGLSFTRTEFGGIQHVLVYRIAHVGTGPIPFEKGLEGDKEETSRRFADMGLELAEARDYRMASATFRWLFDFDPASRLVYGNLMRALETGADIGSATLAVRALLNAWSDEGRNDYAGAREKYRAAVRHDPRFALPYRGLAMIALVKDDDEATALQCLRTACSLDADLRLQLSPFVKLLSAKNYQAIIQGIEQAHVQVLPEFLDWLKRRAEASKKPAKSH